MQYLSMPSKTFSHKYKKAIKSTSTFGPPCLVYSKKTENVGHILKTTISKSIKKRYRLRAATRAISESGSGNAT